ncbi:MAG TPA: hypothetical protein VMN57_00430 [Anaerolineales bacterium]|nr:hypothetical protein [Anaerolineales bacterium]
MEKHEHEHEHQVKESGWASPVDHLHVGDVSAEAINLNVEGRKLSGVVRGFGQMWQKTYKVRLSGLEKAPEEVIETWRTHFPEFWPEGNRLFIPLTGIKPGEVGVINLKAPGGLKLSTGIMVIFSDATSFSFMTPEGHMFAGMITFSAFEEDGDPVAQIQALIRANDPLYEMSFRAGVGHKIEDEFWKGTLANLAARFQVSNPQVTQNNILVDPRMQWKEWRNIFKNAGIRSSLYMPVVIFKRVFRRK